MSEKLVKEERGRCGDGLLVWEQLPVWRQDNEFILASYRPTSGSIQNSLGSLKYIHNETVNIFSHLFGGILFLSLPFYLYKTLYHRYESASTEDIVVFSAFFFGVATCFFLSACFHTVANHSHKVACTGIQFDYVGIVILMWGSSIATIYYGLICDPHLQKTYWVVVTALASTCIVLTLDPKFNHPNMRVYRATMYSSFGLSALLFIIHGILLHGWEAQVQRMSLDWMGWMTAFNFIGAVAYAARVPERWYPGAFDVVGSSHQILHFMVIFAGIAHMFGLLRAFDHVHGPGLSCGLEGYPSVNTDRSEAYGLAVSHALQFAFGGEL